jgi:NADH:ubiquinone reductase (H+-translocating)
VASAPFVGSLGDGPAVIVVGGGYAGMAAIVSLRRLCPGAGVTLVDPGASHLKITHLHESFRSSPPPVRLSFRLLAERFRFEFIQEAVAVDGERLCEWERAGSVGLSEGPLPYDYLLLATGASVVPMAKSGRVCGLEDLAGENPRAMREHLAELVRDGGPVSVVGGGATGIQFLFEIAQWMKRSGLANPLRLIDTNAEPLRQFPPAMRRYVRSRLRELGVSYWPNRAFREQREQELWMDGPIGGQAEPLPSALSFVFTGKSTAQGVETNAAGQVLVGGRTLRHVFAAGDCSRYRAPGSNAMTAQSAIRKGKLGARNILRHFAGSRCLEPYLHRDLGYVVSLGATDAVGWLGCKAGHVAGAPAVALKELVESQQELLLAGIDTYVV